MSRTRLSPTSSRLPWSRVWFRLPTCTWRSRTLPGYVLEQTGEISQTRAENEGRKGEPTFGDMVKALPAAAVSAWMEKIGTSKMLGLDDVALTELKQLPKELFKTLLTEGATEAAQEAAMIGGEQAFTNKGIDWWQAMERVAQSALVGSIFGPAVKAPIAGVQIATAPGKEEEVVEPAADTEGQSTPKQPAGTPQGPESGISTPGTLGGTPAPPPADAGEDVRRPDTADAEIAAAAGGHQPVDPDVAAAAGAPAAAQPAAGAIPEPDEEEDVDIEAAPAHRQDRSAAGQRSPHAGYFPGRERACQA